jgi:hypothetical protein
MVVCQIILAYIHAPINIYLRYSGQISWVTNDTVLVNSVPPDPTMTVDNVTQTLKKIPGDKWLEVMGGLDIPKPLLKEIQKSHSTDAEKNHACADYYVNYHPAAEWEHLTARLYQMKEFTLARESKSFMSMGKNTNSVQHRAFCIIDVFIGRIKLLIQLLCLLINSV